MRCATMVINRPIPTHYRKSGNFRQEKIFKVFIFVSKYFRGNNTRTPSRMFNFTLEMDLMKEVCVSEAIKL